MTEAVSIAAYRRRRSRGEFLDADHQALEALGLPAALDVELGTVRSRLTRARQRLREVVLSMGGDASDLFGTETVPET